MIKDLSSIEIIFFGSVLSLAISYASELFFLIFGLISILREKTRLKSHKIADSDYPSISIIVPCYNEESVIHRTIKYLKRIDYPNFNTIFINDGSHDNTLEAITKELPLITFLSQSEYSIPTRRVRSISTTQDGSFFVIDKENGGKADALNTGINISNSDLICCVDADTIIKTDSLKRMAMQFLSNKKVVASGGNVRIKNGSEQIKYFPNKIKAPDTLIAKLQVIEYLRSINIARNAFAVFNANLIISGAFGLFKTDIIKEIGGYEKFSKGEDIELITRIHLRMKKTKTPYKVVQSYYADAFTDAPESYRELKSQRKRWQLGLISTLRGHFTKFLKHPFSPVTFITIPYLILFEVILPIIQLISYFLIPALIILNVIKPVYLLILLYISIFSILVNMLFLIMDFSLNSYYRFSDKIKIFLSSFTEPLFYHQINCYWKLLGLISFFKNIFVKSSWVPPRGNKDYQSMIGKEVSIGDLGSIQKLRVIPDYKSLNKDKIIILFLEGSFESGDTGTFQELIQYFEGKNRNKFILDLGNLENLSTEALSLMINISRNLRGKQGKMVLTKTPSKINNILKISNAIKELKSFEDYSNAIKGIQYG